LKSSRLGAVNREISINNTRKKTREEKRMIEKENCRRRNNLLINGLLSTRKTAFEALNVQHQIALTTVAHKEDHFTYGL